MMRETKKLNFEPLAISYYIYVIFSFLYALCPMRYVYPVESIAIPLGSGPIYGPIYISFRRKKWKIY